MEVDVDAEAALVSVVVVTAVMTVADAILLVAAASATGVAISEAETRAEIAARASSGDILLIVFRDSNGGGNCEGTPVGESDDAEVACRCWSRWCSSALLTLCGLFPESNVGAEDQAMAKKRTRAETTKHLLYAGGSFEDEEVLGACWRWRSRVIGDASREEETGDIILM